jgi:hypothetical protein
MKLAGLEFKELIAILNQNGYHVLSDDFWDKHNRIILRKENETVVLQFDMYYGFPFVYTFLTSLGIEVPEHCKTPYEQFLAYKNSNNHNNN